MLRVLDRGAKDFDGDKMHVIWEDNLEGLFASLIREGDEESKGEERRGGGEEVQYGRKERERMGHYGGDLGGEGRNRGS